MASANIHQFSARNSSRDRLAAMRDVNIFDRPPGYNRDGCTAFILAGIRSYEIRQVGAGYRTLFHLRDGIWLALALGVSEDEAFAAVIAHVEALAGVPQWYSPAIDAAERAAAAEVLAAFAAPAALPLAA
jgi:hypothetical protein